MRLTLGSVQFGTSYGISNIAGKVLPSEVGKILRLAKKYNIDTIDTAISYGDSESVLGDVGVDDFQIITKLPPLPDNLYDVSGWLEKEVEGSLSRLQKNSIHGLLVHHAEYLEESIGQKFGLALNKVKSSGLVKKVGVSIYQPSVLEVIMKNAAIDIVQAPFNVVDRSIMSSGWLDKLNKAGIEVHVRSIFMQGLLLMDRPCIPDKFKRWSAIWDYWHENLNKHNLDALTQCVSFVNSYSNIDRLVIGIESASQLQQILDAIGSDHTTIDWSQMTCDDDMLINPSNWSKL